MVYFLVLVSNYALPTSTVLPFSFSSSQLSITYANHHESLPFSLASYLYLSIVLASTTPIMYIKLPQIVDLPASTWPIKTIEHGSLLVSTLTNPSGSIFTVKSLNVLTIFFSIFSDSVKVLPFALSFKS